MKRLLIIIASISCIFADPMSPVGEWKLTGLRVDYMDIARDSASVIVSDAYGLGISTSLGEIVPGSLFNTTVNGPFTNATLEIAGVNLNVNLDPPSGGSPVGSGSIGQGSYYPDVDIGTNADGSPDCITTGKIFPITDTFSWTAPGTQFNFSQTNILGKTSANALAGGYAEGLGVFGSSVFDNWPDVPTTLPIPSVLPYIASSATEVHAVGCGAACTTPSDLLGGATLSQYQFNGDDAACVSTCSADTYGNGGCANWGTCLPGEYGGMFSTAEGTTQFTGNDVQDINFVLEWHAIDGTASESGLGDIIGQDEDGDGTDYDRIFGLPYIGSTYVSSANPMCDITGGALTAAGTYAGCLGAVAGGLMPDLATCLAYYGYEENNGLTKPIAGDIVDQLGSAAGCGAYPTEAEVAACNEAAIAGLVSGGCLDKIRAGVVSNCVDAGGVSGAVFAGCVDQANGEILETCETYVAGAEAQVASTCSAYGAPGDTAYDACYDGNVGAAQAAAIGGVIEAACVEAGGPATVDESIAAGLQGMTCADIGAAYATQGGGTCAGAAGLAGMTCEDSNNGSLCCLAGSLGAAQYTDCTAWADSFEDATLDGISGDQIPGWGAFSTDPGSNMTCSDWGNTYIDNCIALGDGYNVQGATDFYLMDLQLANWGYFMTWNAAQYTNATTSLITAYCMSGAYTGDPADCGGSDEAANYALSTIANPANGLSWTLDNDGDHEFDASCLATLQTENNPTGDPYACAAGGRLHMTFTPTCVAEVEAHQIVAEFVDLEALQCDATGDVTGGWEDRSCTGCSVPDVNDFDGDGNTTEDICNVDANFNQMIDPEETCSNGCWDCSVTDDDGNVTGGLPGGCTDENGGTYQGDCYEAAAGDGIVNVADLTRLVNHILGTDPLGGYLFCAGDVNTSGNGAGVINVGDLVSVINIIFDFRVSNGAQDAIVEYNNNEVNIVADGFVAGAELIVEFSNDSFNVELAESFIGNSVRHGNNLHIVMANKDQTIENVLSVTEGEIISVSSAALFNNSGEEVVVTFDEIQPEAYRIVEAYPNPFNPSTTIGVELYTQSDLSIKVYNLTGQLVDEIANGNFSPNTYTWTWDAKGYASGIYFVTTKVGNEINNQKVMLIK